MSLIHLPPPRLEYVPEEGKSKVKERHEVGEGGDTVTIEDTSDEEDVLAPPRRTRNVARKCIAKKLKITESTAQEVSSLSSVVECLTWSIAC
jgi:hypothetical protein